jgi:hypothetical protein
MIEIPAPTGAAIGGRTERICEREELLWTYQSARFPQTQGRCATITKQSNSTSVTELLKAFGRMSGATRSVGGRLFADGLSSARQEGKHSDLDKIRPHAGIVIGVVTYSTCLPC